MLERPLSDEPVPKFAQRATRILINEGQETELVSELHARAKALEVSVLLEVCMLASSSTCSVDSRIRQLYLLSWIRDWTGVKLRTTVKKQILCTSLPVDTELIVTHP